MCLAQGHNSDARVRLEPASPRSRVKHSTTELLRSTRTTCARRFKWNDAWANMRLAGSPGHIIYKYCNKTACQENTLSSPRHLPASISCMLNEHNEWVAIILFFSFCEDEWVELSHLCVQAVLMGLIYCGSNMHFRYVHVAPCSTVGGSCIQAKVEA